MVLMPGLDIKRGQDEGVAYESAEADFAAAEAPRRLKQSATASSLETAQVSGVWGQPAQAQELSATGRKPMIVYSGDVQLKVSRLKEAADSVLKLIDQYQGYLSNLQEFNYETSQSVSITARIPAAKVFQFLEEVKKLGEVVSSNLSGDEVTEEYFDLQAQLEALRVSEARLKEMLARSGKLSDLLEIERELSNKQSQVNQVVGRMKYLEDRSALGTLSIALVTEAPPPHPAVGFTWDLGEVFSQSWVSLKYTVRRFVHGLIVLAVGAIFWLPLLAVIVFVLWLLWRWAVRSGIIAWQQESRSAKGGRTPAG